MIVFLLCPAAGHFSLSWAQAPQAEETPETIEAFPDVPSELSLFEDIPMVVTASKKPERITEAPSIISVITQEDIERMGARTITDVLRIIPGIEIMKESTNIPQIAVRGLRSDTSSGVKILVDGHTLNDPITGGATVYYNDLPLKNVRRIEIIRGPASALYGANAFVSVINILTKRAQDIDGVDVSIGGGSFQSFNPSLLFGKVWHDIEMTFYADYATTEGAEVSIESDALSLYDTVAPSFGVDPISLAPGTFQEPQEKLDLSSTIRYGDVTFRTKFLDKHREPFLTDFFILSENSSEDLLHWYAELEYRRFMTQRVEFSGKIYSDYFQYESIERVAPGLTLFSSEESDGVEPYQYPEGIVSRYYGESRRFGAEGQLNIRLFQNNDLEIGVAYEYFTLENVSIQTNLYNSDFGFPPNELYDLREIVPDLHLSSFQNFAAIYLQDTWQIRHDVDLILGARGDYFSDVGGVFTPKIGMTYEPTEKLNFKLLFGTAFRIPSFAESLLVYSGDENAEVSDDLVVEELHTFEIGLGYKPVDWLVAEVNYFNSTINELTEATDEETAEFYPIGTTVPYQNVGGIDVQGVELELRGKSERKISLGIIPRIISSTFRMNYSYQDTQDSTTHEKVPNMAVHKGNIGLGFTLSAEEPQAKEHQTFNLFRKFSEEFSLYFNLFLCGERQRSPEDLRDDLPGFGTLDMTLTAHDVFHKGVDLSFSIENMFDKDYRDPSPELTADDPFSTIADDFPNAGRTFFLELRHRF